MRGVPSRHVRSIVVWVPRRAGVLFSLGLVVALLLAGVALIAAIVFGPQTYNGTGRPVLSRHSFTVPTGGSGYILRVRNNRVWAAMVILNGRIVLRPADFLDPPGPAGSDNDSWESEWERMRRDWRADRNDRTRDLIEKAVTLRPGTNTLIVAFIARTGRSFSLEIATPPATDTTPPVITASAAPAPNSNGWNATNVTVSFSCSDAGSGVATCPPAVVTTTEGAGQVVSGTAVDHAGNQATASVSLNIDKTAPTGSASVLPPPNAFGWHNAAPTVRFTCSDALSGVASCPADVLATTDGAGQTASGTVSDRAGNSFLLVSPSFSLDRAPPSVTVTLSPAPNAAGIYVTPVTAHFTCTDALSGVDVCPPDQSFTASGVDLVATGSASDRAANTATATSPPFTIQLPTSTPTITVELRPTANAAGWHNTPVSAHFTCLEDGQPLAGCPPDQIVSTEGTGLTVTGSVTNPAGQTATVTSAPFNIDRTAPLVTSSLTPPANANGWHNGPVSAAFQCSDSLSGVASCLHDQTFPSEGAGQTATGAATDVAGNVAAPTLVVNIDTTPPVLTLSTPTTGTTVFTPSVTVSGLLTDTLSGADRATCNGAPALITGGALSCVVTLTGGQNTVEATALDRAGNPASASLDYTYNIVPILTIQQPANLAYTSITPTTISGTVDDPAATVIINSIEAAVVNGAFSAALPLAEGPNTITATARSANGAVGTATLTVTLDTTPPHVTVTSPPNQFVTFDAAIGVSGLINDIVVGTVNAEQASVTVNGVAAQVANRTFLASSVPLAVGPNVIQVVGRDRVGNQATTQVTVTRAVPTTEARIQALGGNGQTAAIRAVLPGVLAVALRDGAGNPVPNTPVIFKVTQNDGLVAAAAAPAPTVIATTDAQGRAEAQWTLGGRAGAGGNTVEAYAVGFEGTAIFTATGTQGPAGIIVVDTGNNQIGPLGQRLPRPFIAVVVDEGNNRLAGVPVTFTVAEGGGTIDGEPTRTVVSDPDGRVAATLTLGTQEGNNNNLVSATFESNVGFPAAFTASGRAPGDPARTAIKGVVLDNSNIPIPGVTIRAVLTEVLNGNGNAGNAVTPVQTNAQGQFTIPQAPVGFVKLLVDGSTATLPDSYPSLDYDLVTVSGQSNIVGQPIFLLPLNAANQLCVTETTGGGTLTIPEAPGFSLTFSPGQVTFPGGSRSGCVSVTVVNADKVPMSPGFGQQPRFIVTIQPAGAIFNPPAPITLPNVDGLAPRSVTEMYSFDHDVGSFVAIGTGTVSDDGGVVRSNTGVGVLKAGWHCGGNPQAVGTAADCPWCNSCIATSAHPEGECQFADRPGNSPNDCKRYVCIRDMLFNTGQRLEFSDDSEVPIGPAPECRLQQCSNGLPFPAAPDGTNPASANTCCHQGGTVSKYSISDLSVCPMKTQGTRLHEFDGCTNYPDNAVSIFGSRANVPGTSTVIGTEQPDGAVPDNYPCNLHDLCYQTCGSSKDTCDASLRDGAEHVCQVAYPTAACPYPADEMIGDDNKCEVYFDERASCFRSPGQLFFGVQHFGGGAYRERQQQYCQCCP